MIRKSSPSTRKHSFSSKSLSSQKNKKYSPSISKCVQQTIKGSVSKRGFGFKNTLSGAPPHFCKAIQKLVSHRNTKGQLRETEISPIRTTRFSQLWRHLRSFDEFRGNEKHLVLDVQVRHNIKPHHHLSWREGGKDEGHTWYSRTSSPSIPSVAPTFRLTRSRQEQLWQHAFNMETNPRESSVSEKKKKKGRASGCIKSKKKYRSLFLDIGLKVNIHNAYTQKQTEKK